MPFQRADGVAGFPRRARHPPACFRSDSVRNVDRSWVPRPLLRLARRPTSSTHPNSLNPLRPLEIGAVLPPGLSAPTSYGLLPIGASGFPLERLSVPAAALAGLRSPSGVFTMPPSNWIGLPGRNFTAEVRATSFFPVLIARLAFQLRLRWTVYLQGWSRFRHALIKKRSPRQTLRFQGSADFTSANGTRPGVVRQRTLLHGSNVGPLRGCIRDPTTAFRGRITGCLGGDWPCSDMADPPEAPLHDTPAGR